MIDTFLVLAFVVPAANSIFPFTHRSARRQCRPRTRAKNSSDQLLTPVFCAILEHQRSSGLRSHF